MYIVEYHLYNYLHLTFYPDRSKEEGKYQEFIQSSTTTDPGHHMGKRQNHKKTSHTREPRG